MDQSNDDLCIANDIIKKIYPSLVKDYDTLMRYEIVDLMAETIRITRESLEVK